VAAATNGSQQQQQEPGEAAAMIMGALISIGASAAAGSRAARAFGKSKPPTPHDASPQPPKNAV
jgi:hypothetical protein